MGPPSPPGENAIDLAGVEKRYGRKIHALRGVNLQVRPGQIFGLLGPNGAGKSTLVKILLTLVRPTRVGGTVLGRPVGHRATLSRIGYLPENHRFPRYLTGKQVLTFIAGLHGVPKAAREDRARQLLSVVGMDEWANHKITTYSKGMAQRVGLAQAMINDPDLIILDEPTDGVDPLARRQIRDVLLELRRRGKTVLINSHLLSDLELICDRVAIMVGGQIVQQGTLDELSLSRVSYDFEAENADGARLLQILGGLASAGPSTATNSIPVQVDGTDGLLLGNTLRLFIADAAKANAWLDKLRAQGVAIRRFAPARPSLEDLFIEAVQKHGKADGRAGAFMAGGGPVAGHAYAGNGHAPPVPQALPPTPPPYPARPEGTR
jgi:ABC-2 type transport system ATP-binding protein